MNATCEHLNGSDYISADIATFPCTARYEWQVIALDEFPKVKRWFAMIYARPAVQRWRLVHELLAQG